MQNRCQQYQSTITRLNQEIFSLRQQLEKNQSGIVESQSAVLQRHAEESRRQYEKCLDDVANQVVRALLAQKSLREEIECLNNRIQELESQNKALTSMLVHQLRDSSPSQSEAEESQTKQLELEDSTNKIDGDDDDNTSADASPSTLIQSTLTVKHCNSFNSEILDKENQSDNLGNEKSISKLEKHKSADADIFGNFFFFMW